MSALSDTISEHKVIDLGPWRDDSAPRLWCGCCGMVWPCTIAQLVSINKDLEEDNELWENACQSLTEKNEQLTERVQAAVNAKLVWPEGRATKMFDVRWDEGLQAGWDTAIAHVRAVLAETTIDTSGIIPHERGTKSGN